MRRVATSAARARPPRPRETFRPEPSRPRRSRSLPSLRGVLCEGVDSTKPVSELSFVAPDVVREEVFPDLRALRDETWTLTWEGSLSHDKADSASTAPPCATSQLFVDGGGMRHRRSRPRPFCDAGVEQYDIVQLRGCDPSLGDADCPIGYTCFVHPHSQVAGLGACMLEDEADRLAERVQAFLTSLRRYTVGRTAERRAPLLPRKHVLRTTPLDGCVDDNQCEHARRLRGANSRRSTQPIADHDDAIRTPGRAPSIRSRPARRPGQTGKRCICDDAIALRDRHRLPERPRCCAETASAWKA